MSKIDPFLIPNASFLRLIAEYRKHSSLVIGFDFDGTVNDYHKTGESYDYIVNLLRDLKRIGCKLVCWTAYDDHNYVSDYLKINAIPFDGINTNGIKLPWESRKPFFSALLDDRAGLIQVYIDLRQICDIIMAENLTGKTVN